MRRLTGFDASFLYSESPTVSMHTLKVAVVVPPPGLSPEGRFARFHEELAQLLDRLPAFRRRVVEVPLGLNHPVWVEDPHFDLDYHLRRIAAPPPGGASELDSVIADIASHPLDRAHPLWEIWMVEGLANGRLAFVAKIHHAVADGGASAAMLAAVRCEDPRRAEWDGGAGAREAHAGEAIPGAARLVGEALVAQALRLREAAPLALRTALGGVAVLRRFREASTHPPIPFDTPRTPFNEPLSPTRSFATTGLSLARVKAVKDAYAVTLNDVVLALAGGALVRYLRGRGLEPDRSLIATVPVSIAEPGLEPRLSGNQLSNVFMSLCTDVADPRERLARIHAIAEAAKETHERLGANVLVEWAEFAPPAIASWVIRTYSELELSRLHRPPANAIVSNVRGPGEPLSIAGARLEHIYSVGPILDGIGVNLTAWSYATELAFAVLAGRDAVPDAHLIADALHEALAELEEGAGLGRAVAPSARAPRPRRATVARKPGRKR